MRWYLFNFLSRANASLVLLYIRNAEVSRNRDDEGRLSDLFDIHDCTWYPSNISKLRRKFFHFLNSFLIETKQNSVWFGIHIDYSNGEIGGGWRAYFKRPVWLEYSRPLTSMLLIPYLLSSVQSQTCQQKLGVRRCDRVVHSVRRSCQFYLSSRWGAGLGRHKFEKVQANVLHAQKTTRRGFLRIVSRPAWGRWNGIG